MASKIAEKPHIYFENGEYAVSLFDWSLFKNEPVMRLWDKAHEFVNRRNLEIYRESRISKCCENCGSERCCCDDEGW